MAKKLYGWATHKVANGYEWIITETTPRSTPNEHGRYADTIIVTRGMKATRAQAKGVASKWLKHFKAQAAA
jgi:hypothetical protein